MIYQVNDLPINQRRKKKQEIRIVEMGQKSKSYQARRVSPHAKNKTQSK